MEDVLALYEKPLSEKEPVVCMDEKPVVLHADVRAPRPMWPGRIARRDCEYQRRGTVNAFCGVEPKAGRHFTKITPNRSSPRFADYLVEIVASYPEADTIHLVLDNLSSHNRKALVDRFGEKIGGLLWERFTVHYTPKHGSWLNMAETEIRIMNGQCLDRRLGQIIFVKPRNLRQHLQIAVVALREGDGGMPRIRTRGAHLFPQLAIAWVAPNHPLPMRLKQIG